MAKFLDPKMPVRHEIALGVAYLYRVPTVADVATYERETAAAGGRRWSVWQLWGAILDGLKALAEHGDVADEVAYVETQREALREHLADLDTLPADERSVRMTALGELLGDVRMEEIASAVAPAYPRYRAMLADNVVYRQVRGQVAARLFLVGWEGIDPDVQRGLTGATEATLRCIPQGHFPAIADFVDSLLGPTEAEAGN